MQLVGGLKWPWVVMADWNIEPVDLTSWAKQANAVLVRPWAPTCGAKEYDFAIVSEVLSSRVDSVAVISDGLQSHERAPSLRSSSVRASIITAVQLVAPRGEAVGERWPRQACAMPA